MSKNDVWISSETSVMKRVYVTEDILKTLDIWEKKAGINH